MKTNFFNMDGKWVVKTGHVVAMCYINMGDDYDIILGDQVQEVITGELYGLDGDKLIPNCPEEEQSYKPRRTNKKSRRADRINQFCGVYWTVNEFKRIGKNRKMGRRMYPAEHQIKEFNENLPF